MSHGKFVWFEFLATNIEEALSFYTESIGWKTHVMEMPGGAYRALMVGDDPFGGVVELPEMAAKAGAPPHWLAYIAADDVDAVVAKAEQLGGRVLNPAFDVPGVGRIAILADPQGAAFAAYRAENDAGPTPSPDDEGTMVWSELATSDPEAAVSFYTQLFGWAPTEAIDMGPEGTYRMFGYGDGPSQGGIFDKPAQMPASAWLYYANTKDIDAAAKRIERNGGKLVNGPQDVPGGKIAQFVDPQGGMFALYQNS